jgi:hypothetical protein
MAVVYVPADSGSAVPVGAAVDLAVQSVAPGQYGVLRGRVESVGRTAQSAQQIAAFLGSAQLGEHLAGQGRAVPVRIRLLDAPGTASGHAWSSAEGPPFRLSSMTPADGAVHLAEQHPIDWLLP